MMITFIVSILTAYTVCAQSPFLFSPYHYYNHQVLPTQPDAYIIQQNADQHVPHRDVTMSLMLRELKEMKVAVENVKKEMATEISNLKIDVTTRDQEMAIRDQEILNLKNEVAQLKKTNKEKVEADNLNKTETKTEMLTTELEPVTIDSGENGGIPTARFCNCRLIQETISNFRKELTATNVQVAALAAQSSGTNTARISFHAQLSTSFTDAESTIPFDVIVTNVGGGMSTTTGIFTALVAGTYFFALTGVCTGSSARVNLQKTAASGGWDFIGVAYAESTKDTFAIQSIVSLRKGDEIRAYLDTGGIFDNIEHYTNFVGFLIEEETV